MGYLYVDSKVKKSFIFYFMIFTPLWLVWLLICGGQYDVGTDYFSYYNIFETIDVQVYYNKLEWIFAAIVEGFRTIGMPPQGLFYVFYFINFFFFCKILYLLDYRTSFIFVALYICLSTLFNNQLNGLRQYSAVYIATYALVSFSYYKSYLHYIFWVVIAAGIHVSALLFLPLMLFFKANNISKRLCYILILGGAAFAAFGSFSWISEILKPFLPATYTRYLGGFFDKSNDLVKLITKFIFIPIYFISADVLSDKRLTKEDRWLYIMGVLTYSIRLCFLENYIFNRVGQLFVLVSVMPVFIYLKYLYLKGRFVWVYFILLFIIAFYFLKTVIVPEGEYLYDSIYFDF